MNLLGLMHPWILGFYSFIETLKDRFDKEHRIWTAAHICDVMVNFAIFAFLSKLMQEDAFTYLNYYIASYVATTFASTGSVLISSVCTWQKYVVFQLVPMRRKLTSLYVWAGFLGTYDAALRAAIAVAIGLAFGASPFAPLSSLPMVLIAVVNYALFQGVIQIIIARIYAKSGGFAEAIYIVFMLFNNFVSGMYFPIREFEKVSQALYLFASIYPGHFFLQMVRNAFSGNVDYAMMASLLITAASMVFILKIILKRYWDFIAKGDLWEWRP